FHSGFNDLIVTGLIGLKPRADDRLDVDPLAPADWDFFAIDDLPYHGHKLAILWDKTGARYGLGAGLHVLSDGKRIASSLKLAKLTAQLPSASKSAEAPSLKLNYAINNDSNYFPRISASF